jgi:hypothetical protein
VLSIAPGGRWGGWPLSQSQSAADPLLGSEKAVDGEKIVCCGLLRHTGEARVTIISTPSRNRIIPTRAAFYR